MLTLTRNGNFPDDLKARLLKSLRTPMIQLVITLEQPTVRFVRMMVLGA